MEEQFVNYFHTIASTTGVTLSAVVKGFTLSAAVPIVSAIFPYIVDLYDKSNPRNKAIKDAKEYLEFLKMRGEFANLLGSAAPPYLTDKLPLDPKLLHIFTLTGQMFTGN